MSLVFGLVTWLYMAETLTRVAANLIRQGLSKKSEKNVWELPLALVLF